MLHTRKHKGQSTKTLDTGRSFTYFVFKAVHISTAALHIGRNSIIHESLPPLTPLLDDESQLHAYRYSGLADLMNHRKGQNASNQAHKRASHISRQSNVLPAHSLFRSEKRRRCPQPTCIHGRARQVRRWGVEAASMSLIRGGAESPSQAPASSASVPSFIVQYASASGGPVRPASQRVPPPGCTMSGNNHALRSLRASGLVIHRYIPHPTSQLSWFQPHVSRGPRLTENTLSRPGF